MKNVRRVGQALHESMEAYMLMKNIFFSDQINMPIDKLHELIENIVRARLAVVDVI